MVSRSQWPYIPGSAFFYFFISYPAFQTCPTGQMEVAESSSLAVFLQQFHVSSADYRKIREEETGFFFLGGVCFIFVCFTSEVNKNTSLWSTSFSSLLVKIELTKGERLLQPEMNLVPGLATAMSLLPLQIPPLRTGCFDSKSNLWKGFFRM